MTRLTQQRSEIMSSQGALSRLDEALLLRRVLRFSGVVLLLALPAGLMPLEWMDAIHRVLLREPMPQQRIVSYLARTLCWLYASLGLLTWFVANDVRRYAPLIIVKALAGLAFAIGVALLNGRIGMPWYWSAVEVPSILGICLITLILAFRVSRQSVPAADSAQVPPLA